MYNWAVNYGFNPIIIATKSDKVSKNEKNRQVAVIRKKLNCVEGTPIIPFSALNKSGREEIWEYIDVVYEDFQSTAEV